MIRAKHYIITRYWLKYYADGCCTLCGNKGYIDTTGTKTPAGITVGRLNYCICPNGQIMRKHKAIIPNQFPLKRNNPTG